MVVILAMLRSPALALPLALLLSPGCKGSLEPGASGSGTDSDGGSTTSSSTDPTTTAGDSSTSASTGSGAETSTSGNTTSTASGSDGTSGTSGAGSTGSTSGVTATTGSTGGSTGPDLPADCELVPEAGGCLGLFTRYYFNPRTNTCETFNWGGCDGVVPFDAFADCLATCPDPRPATCGEEGDPGGCAAAFQRWEYNPESGQCEDFTWGGCDGNVPFEDEAACESACE